MSVLYMQSNMYTQTNCAFEIKCITMKLYVLQIQNTNISDGPIIEVSIRFTLWLK